MGKGGRSGVNDFLADRQHLLGRVSRLKPLSNLVEASTLEPASSMRDRPIIREVIGEGDGYSHNSLVLGIPFAQGRDQTFSPLVENRIPENGEFFLSAVRTLVISVPIN